MPDLVSVRGQILPPEDLEYPRGGLGWLRGFGVYETLMKYPGGLFRVEAHMDRLGESLQLLRIAPPDREALRRALDEWAEAIGHPYARCRIVVLDDTPEAWWMIEGAALSGPRPPVAQRALSMWVSPICVPPPPLGAAKTISRVSYELAALEARENGADDAIMPTVGGHLGESTRASVFWREGDRVFTPPLSLGVLPGVTRLLLLDALSERGFPVEEAVVPLERLREADEVFVTSTVRGVAPVVRLSGPNGVETHFPVGAATEAADAAIQELVRADGLLREPPRG